MPRSCAPRPRRAPRACQRARAAPRIDGEIVVAIQDPQVSITSATFQPRDLTGDASDAVPAGKRDRDVNAVGDEPDLERYSITLSLIVP